MLKNQINDHLSEPLLIFKSHFFALGSGYLLMATNILVQFALTPFYLKYLGLKSFGILMLLLSMVNFGAIGIGWMSGGMVRIFAEKWAKKDINAFKLAFSVGKYVYFIYAAILAIFFTVGWALLFNYGVIAASLDGAVFLGALYFILMYESIPERQAFVGANFQTQGNLIEVAKLLFFVLVVLFLLPIFKNIEVIWIALILGVILQRVLSTFYLSLYVPKIGWVKLQESMRPIFYRLAGKEGFQFMAYGMIVLGLQADALIIGALGGAELAGKYTLLCKIPEVIGLILWKIPSTFEPKIIHLDASGNREILKSIFTIGRRWFFCCVLLSAIGYGIFGHWVTKLWVGENAPSDDWMYYYAAAALFFSAFSKWPISFSYALLNLKGLTKIATTELLLKIFLTIILFQKFSIATPAVAVVVINIFYVAWGYQNLMTKHFGINNA